MVKVVGISGPQLSIWLRFSKLAIALVLMARVAQKVESVVHRFSFGGLQMKLSKLLIRGAFGFALTCFRPLNLAVCFGPLRRAWVVVCQVVGHRFQIAHLVFVRLELAQIALTHSLAPFDISASDSAKA